MCTSKIHDTVAPEAITEQTRKTYQLLEVPVGRSCLCCVLGIGKNRLAKASAGHVDTRFGCNVALHRTAPAARSVDQFLLKQHGSIAEILPTGSDLSNGGGL